MFIFATVLVACSTAHLSSVIVYSEYTPPHVLSRLSLFAAQSSRFDLLMLPIAEEMTLSLDPFPLTAVFDFTYSVSYNRVLKSYCSLRRLICFSEYSISREKWVFGLHPSPIDRAKALQRLCDHLDIKDSHLVASQSQESRDIFRYLSKDTLVVLSSLVDQEVFDLHIGREIKPTGNWKVLAITDPVGASKVLKGLKNLRIFKERCVFIVSSRGTWGDYDEGTILLSEEGLEFSRSEEEYEQNSIERALSVLYKISEEERTTDKERLRDLLEENTINQAVSSTFSIVNLNPDLSVVGNITDSVYIKNAIYPGNVTEINRTPPIINMSGNLGFIERDGSISFVGKRINTAIHPMIDIINANQTLLSNFALEIHGTDCGHDFAEYDYISECMEKHLDHLGAFYIDGVNDAVGDTSIQVFRENGIFIPHTGIFYDSIKYYDKDVYPELFITTAYTLYTYSILPYILNSFRWKEILVYFRDTESPSKIDAFVKNCEILEINIKNQKRLIPNIDEDFGKVNEEALKEAVGSKSRIVVLFLYSSQTLHFIECLYNLGLRKGDAVIVSENSIGSIIDLEGRYGHDKQKVLEIVDGSISMINPHYRGEYGESLEKQIAEMIYPTSTRDTCYQIDSLLLGVYTIDLMLKIGRNYEDPLDMNYFMRQVYFTGCSGRVSIDSQGNGRSDISFILRNFYVKEDGQWVEEDIGYYTIGIMIPLHISKDITWPNGSKELPEDMREEPECGIKESDIQSNNSSIMITVYGSIAHFVIVFVIGLIVWFKFYRFKTERITERTEIMFEDGIEIVTPFIEGFQTVAIGPGISILTYISGILNIDSLLDFKHGLFWRVFYTCFGISAIWSFCIVSAMTRFDRRFPKGMKNLTRYIGLTFLPLFSKIGFLVLGWMIIKVFDCKEGTSDEATDAFLKDDCNVRCWKGFHLGISIPTFLVFTFYSILSTISHTVYDEAMDHVNIKTSPFFSIQKSFLKIALLIFHLLFCPEHSLALSVIYFVASVAWTIFCFKIETFNFVRLAMWQSLVSLGVSCHFLACLVKEIRDFDSLIILFIDLVLILGVLGVGFSVQILYLPGYFFKKQSRNFDKLLKFAYTYRMDPKDLTNHELDYCFRRVFSGSVEIYQLNEPENY